MKAFIITLKDIPESVDSTKLCIESAKQFGIDVEKFDAITPKTAPSIWDQYNLKARSGKNYKFNIGSKDNWNWPVISCFMSHWHLWQKCIDINENILVLEHDMLFFGALPNDIKFKYVLNICAPPVNIQYPENIIDTTNYILAEEKWGNCAGSYIITPECARILVHEIKNGISLADRYFHKLADSNKINILKLKPAICYTSINYSTLVTRKLLDNKPGLRNIYTNTTKFAEDF